MILILGFKMTAVSQEYISSAKLEMHKICLCNPFVSPLTPLLNLQHKKKKALSFEGSKQSKEWQPHPSTVNMLHCNSSFWNVSLDILSGTPHLCQTMLAKANPCMFSHIKGDHLSLKWIQTTLRFKTTELNVCQPVNNWDFQKEEVWTRRYECGNPYNLWFHYRSGRICSLVISCLGTFQRGN